MKPTVSTGEIIESLISIAGTAERAAGWLHVTPQAVSTWRNSGGMSTQSQSLAVLALTRYRVRESFLRGWLYQRTTGKPGRVNLVVELYEGGAVDEPVLRSRSQHAYQKDARDEVVRFLATAYMTAEMIVDGDAIVFCFHDATEIVYLDDENVAVSFTRREWEPFAPLRAFIRKPNRGKK